MTGIDMRAFVRGYVECALWSSTDWADEQGGEPLDANYSADDISPDALAEINTACAQFAFETRDALRVYVGEWSEERAGHDFWLTRNGHGTGYWDRTYAPGSLYDACERLAAAARVYGSSDLYVGDDGCLYV